MLDTLLTNFTTINTQVHWSDITLSYRVIFEIQSTRDIGILTDDIVILADDIVILADGMQFGVLVPVALDVKISEASNFISIKTQYC